MAQRQNYTVRQFGTATKWHGASLSHGGDFKIHPRSNFENRIPIEG